MATDVEPVPASFPEFAAPEGTVDARPAAMAVEEATPPVSWPHPSFPEMATAEMATNVEPVPTSFAERPAGERVAEFDPFAAREHLVVGPIVREPSRSEVRRGKAREQIAQVKDELVAWVKTLVSAAVYAVLIVTFGFQVARVEGQSMAPTLADQDRLIVNKLVYRIGEPRRGDIVMLYYPLNPDKSFVKRVIAEEGDTVRIIDGRVYVNDVPLSDEYVPVEFRSHDDWGPQVIPEGYYFVMGDHRNNSSDSRHWGMVPKRYIIGKVQLRWWPVPSARVF
jgi:signal peptidase I